MSAPLKVYRRSDDLFGDTTQAESTEAAAVDWFTAFDATDTTQFLAVTIVEQVELTAEEIALYGDDGEPLDEDDVTCHEGEFYKDGDSEEFTRVLDPTEPECDEDAHSWTTPHDIVGGLPESPGVVGSGGGTRSHEVCKHCGCGRITDTWATNPNDGTEGHTTIEYRPEYAASRTQR